MFQVNLMCKAFSPAPKGLTKEIARLMFKHSLPTLALAVVCTSDSYAFACCTFICRTLIKKSSALSLLLARGGEMR